MSNWFSKILTNKKEVNRPSATRSLDETILLMVAFLEEQITDIGRASSILESSKKFAKQKNQRINQLPFYYLAFEQYLTEIDSEKIYTVERLRKRIKERFPQLLVIPEFSLIFDKKEKQQILLCRHFIKKMLETTIESVGDAQEGLFKKIGTWMNEVPNVQTADYSFLEVDSMPFKNEDWLKLLEEVTVLIFNKLENQFGENWTKRIFSKAYHSTTKLYSPLPTFPIIIALIPDKFLDADQIGILSKHQLTNILMDKTAYLEELNESLAQKNQELEIAKQEILEGKHRVENMLSRFSSVLNTVNEGIIYANSKSKIVFVNPAVERIFGYTEEELIGANLTVIMPDKYKANHRSGMKRYMTTRKPSVLNKTVQLEGQRKNGQIFPLEINIAQSEIDDEIYFTAAVKDVTERVRMEQALRSSRDELEIRVKERTKDLQKAQTDLKETITELKRSNTELEQFAYIVSHDLQEPLRVVGNYADLMKKTSFEHLDNKSKDYLDFMQDGVKRMRQLIRDLLNYSRVGRANSNFKLANISDLIFLAENNLKTKIESSEATLEISEMPKLNVDRTLIVQLFQNLIGNAIKFRSKAIPHIQIRSVEKDNHWKFEVQDNGIGIDDVYLEEIFIAFQRVNDELIEGSGIGLAVCQKIIQLHNGKIWATSEKGKGSTFHFTLPKSDL